MTPEPSFGAWLKQRRKALDLTQGELAEHIGCAVSTLQKIEAGRRRPSRDFARRMADVMGIPPDRHQAFVQYARAGRSVAFRPPTNLPAPSTPFIGRQQELSDVCKLLLRVDVRLVTLVGPPGIGKTRLGLEVAAQVRDHFDHGVFLVELAAIPDAAMVVPAILRTLDLKEVGVRSPVDRLTDYLYDRHMLLVLDNFEQVIEAAPQVAKLLNACPLLKLLATSRRPLRIRAERQYPVPPLALPPLATGTRPEPPDLATFAAVEFFVDRAQAVEPGFAITAANVAAVALLCHRLDGLPLAIELIAARIKVMTPEQLFARLGGRLFLQTDGLRDIDERQQTLENTIAWSFELLTAREQALFARLAVFVGGWTLEAAEAVCSDQSSVISDQSSVAGDQSSVAGDQGEMAHTRSLQPGDRHLLRADVADGLAALLAQSLVVRREQGGESRFSMLQMIREYALERLEEGGESEELQRRHALYFLSLAEAAETQLTRAEQGHWLDLLEREMGNTQAAIRWALKGGDVKVAARLATALALYWFRRGLQSQGRRWFDAILPILSVGAAQAGVRARALQAAGLLALSQGSYEQATGWLKQSLALLRAEGSQPGQEAASALSKLGIIAMNQGSYGQARAYFEEGLALSRAVGAQANPTTAVLLGNLAELALREGDSERAAVLQQECLALFRESGDLWNIAQVLDSLGEIAWRQGDYRRAAAFYQESLSLHRQLGSRSGVAGSLINLAALSADQADYPGMAELLEEALRLLRESGDGLGMARCLEEWTALAMVDARPIHAARLLGAAARLRETLDTPVPPGSRGRYERQVAAVARQLGDEAFATAWAEGQAMTQHQAVAYALEEHEDAAAMVEKPLSCASC